jgi:hypothetical protein
MFNTDSHLLYFETTSNQRILCINILTTKIEIALKENIQYING